MERDAAGDAPVATTAPPVHPAIAPLSFLLGRWKGEGEGGFPTINSFKYGEELKFSHSGKPVIAYTQNTWKLASGEPMHAESGYWRPIPDGSIEVVIAQSTGIVEVQVVLNWLMAQENVIPIPGAKNAEQAKEFAGALGWRLTDEEIAELRSLASEIRPVVGFPVENL